MKDPLINKHVLIRKSQDKKVKKYAHKKKVSDGAVIREAIDKLEIK